MSGIATTVEPSEAFDAAVDRVTAALAAEGVGVVSRLDLDATFNAKPGVDFRRCAILGGCNPKLAHDAVSARPEVGLPPPCDVTVEETEAGTRLGIVDADATPGVGGLGEASEIASLAEDARGRLGRVAAALGARRRRAPQGRR